MLLLSSMCLCLSWLLVLLGVLYWYKWFRLWEWGHLCSLKNSIFLVDWRGLVCWLLCVSLYLCWFDEHLCGYIVFCSTDCYAFSLVVHAKWYLPHLLVWNTYMCVLIFFSLFFSLGGGPFLTSYFTDVFNIDLEPCHQDTNGESFFFLVINRHVFTSIFCSCYCIHLEDYWILDVFITVQTRTVDLVYASIGSITLLCFLFRLYLWIFIHLLLVWMHLVIFAHWYF